MQLITQTESVNNEMKFFFSCEYFDQMDQPSHINDFIVDLNQDKPIGYAVVDREIVTAA